MYYYEAKLLSPLFYRTRPDSGAAGATTTDPWIGDLALAYAINASLGLSNISFKYNSSKPDYNEIIELPFFVSVALPLPGMRFTRVYDTATSFISQGYFNKKAFDKTGNAPMRNWLKRQGIAPGSKFQFAMAVSDNWYPPQEFTVRLGNMKESLVLLKRVDSTRSKISINLYTLMLFLKHKNINYNIEELAKDIYSSDAEYQSMMEYVMPQYVILRNVQPEKWLSYIEGFH
ncbi:MAG: hypothetical protein QXU18_03220 [Thermoplasmatales archaeon]